MKAVIEVGANRGTDTKKLWDAHRVPIFSFEPVPKLYEMLSQKFTGFREIHIINQAVVGDPKQRIVDFHISTDVKGMAAKYGASSIYPFRQDLKEKWNRPDFVTSEIVKVKATTLEDFINKMKISSVEFLHCDAQGNDVEVIRGLRSMASRVKRGVIEVTDKIPLYDGPENTLAAAREVFSYYGFRETEIRKNDRVGAELNVFFEKM